MLFAGMACILTVISAAYAVRNLVEQMRYRTTLRVGLRVSGEVVDVATKPRYNGGVTVTPIVRYHIGGKDYRGEVVNRVGKLELGSHLDLVVDERLPWTPWAVYQVSAIVTLFWSAALVAIPALLFWYAIDALRG